MLITCKEFQPSAHLKPYVDSYTYQVFTGMDSGEISPIQRCLPLGMTEIIIIVNDAEIQTFVDGIWHRMPKASFIGLYRDPALWRCVGNTVMFYITLKPETLLHLFKVPVSAMFNAYTDLRSFLGKRTDELTSDLYGVQCPNAMVEVAETFLGRRLEEANVQKNYLDEALCMIRCSKGNISIDELSRSLKVSERKLQRGFKDVLGTTPKTYTRIIRFRNAYEQMEHSTMDRNVSWTDITYDHGYADQAHFIREFKEFSGALPTIIYQEEKQFFQPEEELFYN